MIKPAPSIREHLRLARALRATDTALAILTQPQTARHLDKSELEAMQDMRDKTIKGARIRLNNELVNQYRNSGYELERLYCGSHDEYKKLIQTLDVRQLETNSVQKMLDEIREMTAIRRSF